MQPSRTGLTILVVDDHPVVRRGMTSMLEQESWVDRVVEAATVREGERVAVAEKPGLAVVDLGLPDGSGLELIRRIRQSVRDCAVLVLTMTRDDTLVRTILSVDEAAQSMTFAGDIPEESIVQLMRANFDRLIEGASEAGRQARLPGDQPCLSVAVSCVGRRLVLGERTEEEVDAVLESLPEGAPLVGFYSYGEISPLAAGQCGALHNQTMTLTRYWEG